MEFADEDELLAAEEEDELLDAEAVEFWAWLMALVMVCQMSCISWVTLTGGDGGPFCPSWS